MRLKFNKNFYSSVLQSNYCFVKTTVTVTVVPACVTELVAVIFAPSKLTSVKTCVPIVIWLPLKAHVPLVADDGVHAVPASVIV